jgi:hypothetical protein
VSVRKRYFPKAFWNDQLSAISTNRFLIGSSRLPRAESEKRHPEICDFRMASF